MKWSGSEANNNSNNNNSNDKYNLINLLSYEMSNNYINAPDQDSARYIIHILHASTLHSNRHSSISLYLSTALRWYFLNKSISLLSVSLSVWCTIYIWCVGTNQAFVIRNWLGKTFLF